MSRSRRALLLLGLALVLGGLAASDVMRREAALRAQVGSPVDVVVAAADLRAGQRLRLGDLAVRRLPRRYAPVGGARVPAALVGRRLAAGVPRDGYLGATLLELEGPAAGPVVARGERAADVIGLGPPELVVAGARVDVLVTRDAHAGGPTGTELALEDVEVLAARRPPEAATGDERGPRVQATLRVSIREAVYLTAAQSFAREVRLLPRAAGDRARSGTLRVGRELR